jgi:transposase
MECIPDLRRLPTYDEQKYERRNVVERPVGRLKERRRIATLQGEEDHPKRSDSLKAMLQWAFIGEYLK